MSYLHKTFARVAELAAIQRRDLQRYPYLLDSVAKDSCRGRYGLLFAFPQRRLACYQAAELPHFFSAITDSCQASVDNGDRRGVPFTGGWFIYLGYEAAKAIEPSVDYPEFLHDFPVAFASRCPAAIIVDYARQETHCVCETDYQHLLAKLLADVDARPVAVKPTPLKIHPLEPDPQEYMQGVDDVLRYIQSGDVYQVNLSRLWRVELDDDVDSACLFQRLGYSNPAPFACFVHHEQGDIIGSSPERLVRVSDRKIETRPIAGTRPRSGDEQDKQWLYELRTDAKERAEHIMLIDLERNDLGRVCEFGSVQVDEMMALEAYAHVHHIVSNISGRLREDVTPMDVLTAVFPGGTITGCPKVRCMEIIAELERQGRGPYTGSVGYLNLDGSMDFNILIRTLFRQRQMLQFRTGAGIVADSRPARELQETRHKAKGLLRALGET